MKGAHKNRNFSLRVEKRGRHVRARYPWRSDGIGTIGWRRGVASSVVLALLAVASAAGAASDETTTTTTTTSPTSTTTAPSTTTTTPSTTTTTSSTTTTEPEEPEPAPEEQRVIGTMAPPAIIFPVAGPHSFRDTFGAPRDGGRRWHEGTDILADKGVPVVAVADGTILTVGVGRLAGQYITIRHGDGWVSKYVHLNNDTVGTDDGLATGFAEGIREGMTVTAGTVIGFVGDSGNAEGTVPHLHFAIDQPDGKPINPYPALVNAGTVETIDNGGNIAASSSLQAQAVAPAVPAVETVNTELVGFLDPDGTGFNAGIALSGDHAYMGTWGRPDRCPGTGVRVIDVSEPAEPEKVAAFATADEFPGTSAEAIWVGEVNTAQFNGRLAVAGIRLCENNWRGRLAAEFAGIAIYDVTEASEPVLLSTVHSGENTQGVHHVDVTTFEDRLLVAATVPQSQLHHPDGAGDVRIYDVTDPANVVDVLDWDLRRDGPSDLVDELMTSVGDEALSGHSVTWIGEGRVVVAHSAAGLVALDITDPTSAEYVGAISPYDQSQIDSAHEFGEGHGHNAHSGWLLAGRILVQDDQHLDPQPDEDGAHGEWGQQVFYDIADSVGPRQISTFGTENSRVGEDGEVGRDGFYSAHQSVPFGETQELVTWFSDGVRIVDLTDPYEPTEVASFVPPPREDPQGYWVAPDGTREFPMIWGATSDGDMVYASDINSGLWVFEVTSAGTSDSSPTPSE